MTRNCRCSPLFVTALERPSKSCDNLLTVTACRVWHSRAGLKVRFCFVGMPSANILALPRVLSTRLVRAMRSRQRLRWAYSTDATSMESITPRATSLPSFAHSLVRLRRFRENLCTGSNSR